MTDPVAPLLRVEVTFQAVPGPWTWEEIEAFSDRLTSALATALAGRPWLTDPRVAADCQAGAVTAGVTVPAGLHSAGGHVLVDAGMGACGDLVLECPPARCVRRDRTRTPAGARLKSAARQNASQSAP